MDIAELGRQGLDWIREAKDIDQWRALVDMTDNSIGPRRGREFLVQLKEGCALWSWFEVITAWVVGIWSTEGKECTCVW